MAFNLMVPGDRDRRGVLIAAVILVCASLFLTAYTKDRPALAMAGSRLLAETMRPLQALTSSIRRSATDLWMEYIALVDVRREKGDLAKRLAVLESRNAKLLELESENKRLRALFDIQTQHDLRGVVASVIAYDPSNWVEIIHIDKGAQHGIGVGMPVVAGSGVVGQVITSDRLSSRVLLLIDRSSGIDAVLQGSRVRGIVEGASRFRAVWSHVLSEEEVSLGDRVVTSGLDGVFPKGMLIGVVSDVRRSSAGRLFQFVELQSAVDFSRLESVLVVISSEEGEQNAFLE